MNTQRMPDERFADLTGHSFAHDYVEIGDLRMHYAKDKGEELAGAVAYLIACTRGSGREFY